MCLDREECPVETDLEKSRKQLLAELGEWAVLVDELEFLLVFEDARKLAVLNLVDRLEHYGPPIEPSEICEKLLEPVIVRAGLRQIAQLDLQKQAPLLLPLGPETLQFVRDALRRPEPPPEDDQPAAA